MHNGSKTSARRPFCGQNNACKSPHICDHTEPWRCGGGGAHGGGGGVLDSGAALDAVEELVCCSPVAVAPEGKGCEEAQSLLALQHQRRTSSCFVGGAARARIAARTATPAPSQSWCRDAPDEPLRALLPTIHRVRSPSKCSMHCACISRPLCCLEGWLSRAVQAEVGDKLASIVGAYR